MVAVAHGSRDSRAEAAGLALLDRVRALRPGLRTALGYIEIARPSLAEVLAAHPPGGVVLVPLLLGRGHHLRYDLPAAGRAAPWLRCSVAAALGPHPLLADALADRVAAAPTPYGRRAPDGLVLAAAGSRDPGSAADAEASAALLSARLGDVPVLPGYLSATAPTVPRALAALRARGCQRPFVASYFTAPGHFAARCAALAGQVPTSPPLGPHPALARLLLTRYDEACATLPATGRAGTGSRPGTVAWPRSGRPDAV
ncbi:sirohydrochlorin chelatase [Streptomyces sp. XM4193]|nr:sirohydrochlorin chelatase [Streptomyces sp. XM4193]